MKIMVISDLHYEFGSHHGIDQSDAWNWLLSIVDYHRPDLLLSCGDWGHAVNSRDFFKLLNKTIVLGIYGNHDNIEVLKNLYNIRTSEYLPVLMEDGKVYIVYGTRITGINGIISSKREIRNGVPRKIFQDFIEIAKKLEDESIDILLIHAIPAIKEIYPDIRVSRATLAVLKTIRIIQPKIVFNGHLRRSCYAIYKFNDIRTIYIRIDSSQRYRCYSIYDTDNEELEVWSDFERKMTL